MMTIPRFKFRPIVRRRSLADRQRLQEEYDALLAQKPESQREEERQECADNHYGSQRRYGHPDLLYYYCAEDGHIKPYIRAVRVNSAQDKPAYGTLGDKRARFDMTDRLQYKKPRTEESQWVNKPQWMSRPQWTSKRRVGGSQWKPKVTTVLPIYHCPGMSATDEWALAANMAQSYPTPAITFPDLRECLVNLLGNLVKQNTHSAALMDYPALLGYCGISPEDAVSEAMAQIEPEILKLQGQILTPTLLQDIHGQQLAQGNHWPEQGGYVDWVTDDREQKYARFYIGQSSKLPRRISVEHAGDIRNGGTETLHHFVLARGCGQRFAHFLRLWSGPTNGHSIFSGDGTEDEKALAQLTLAQNLLKMTFCRAFESLPGSVLTEFFGPGEYSNVGLNNLPPVFEGGDIPATIRAKYTALHRDSPDPDISAFSEFRKQRNAERKNSRRQYGTFLRTDYRKATEQLIRDTDIDPESLILLASPADYKPTVDIEAKLKILENEATNTQEIKPFATPVRNWKAKIGIATSSESTMIEYQGRMIQPLEGLRLNERNSLSWTTSFEKFGSGPSRFRFGSDEHSQITKLNYSVIMQSSIRVIVLCGLRAQHDILFAFQNQQLGPYKLSGPHKLPLRENLHHIWLLHSGKDISKLFITSPEPLIKSFLQDTTQMRRLRDVFGLVSTLTDEKIGHTFWENTCFTAAFCAQIRKEKEGGEKLSASTLDSVYSNWLHFRGFTDDEIQELEDVSENLTLAIMQIRAILANRARGRMGAKDQRYRGYRGDFDESSYKKVAELFDRVYERQLLSAGATLAADDSIDTNDPYVHLSCEEPEASTAAAHESQGEPMQETARHDGSEMGISGPSLSTFVEEYALDNPIVNFVSEITLDENDDDGYADMRGADESFGDEKIAQSRKGLNSLHETTLLRRDLEKMLTKTGLESQQYSRTEGHACVLATVQQLIRWTAYPEPGEIFCKKPLFAIRAELSNPGTRHPSCILGDLEEYLPTDPCLRLGIEYRLLDNDDSKGPWKTWKWAKVGVEKKKEYELERIFRANTFVELLQGRTAKELEGVPRRSVVRWNRSKKRGVEEEPTT